MTQAPSGRDPWEGYDEGETYGADALYSGPHEHIPDIILLTEVCLDFETWAEEFRTRLRATTNCPLWECWSVFSVRKSIELEKSKKVGNSGTE